MIMAKWLRLSNYLRWRFATSPVLLHPKTWQLHSIRAATQLPKGEWLLRRPLALPTSTRLVFIGARVFIK
jgi:hypothetical protein